MKVTLIGKQLVSYTQKQTGELKEGMSVFYMAPKESVEGQCSDTIWLRKGSPIYNQLLSQSFTKPLPADVHYEVMPGSRYPVLSEIKILA